MRSSRDCCLCCCGSSGLSETTREEQEVLLDHSLNRTFSMNSKKKNVDERGCEIIIFFFLSKQLDKCQNIEMNNKIQEGGDG